MTESANGTSRPLSSVFEASWRFFVSLRLTVVVITVLAVGCLVGMFYDQTLSYEDHAADWASAAWKLQLFTFLEFHDVFHSWWFGTTILVLALNLTACSIERLPNIWIDIQNPQRHLTNKQLRGIKLKYRKRIDADQKERAEKAMSALFPHRSAFAALEEGIAFRYFERHRFARTGVYLVHIALLIIMGGSIATTNFGLDGMMMIGEGSSGRMVRARGPGGLPYHEDLGFRVEAKDFRLKTFVDGAPMEFESDLAIYDPPSAAAPVVVKTIEVNDPLEYGGYTFYQASYQPIPGEQKVQLAIGLHGKEKQGYAVDIGERVTMPDGTGFVPVDVVQQYGGLGPAVKIQRIAPDGTLTSFFVFRYFPNFDEQVRRGAFDVAFLGFDQHYATGIQVGRVPFIGWVFGGFLLMFVGMYMAFFMSHRRYWARLAPLEDGRYELIVAGAARRHQLAFEEEFEGLRTQLVAVFGPADKPERRRRRKAQTDA